MPKIIFRPNPTPPPFVPPTPPTPPEIQPLHIKITPYPFDGGQTIQVVANLQGLDYQGQDWYIFMPDSEGNERLLLDVSHAVVNDNIATGSMLVGYDTPDLGEAYFTNGWDYQELTIDA